MKFLIDAQLPPRLAKALISKGHEAMHAVDLPGGERTKDRTINEISVESQSIVVSKDMDFFYSHISSGRPWKLLLVRTGNIGSRDLCDLVERNWQAIETALTSNTIVQIDKVNVTPLM